MPVMTVGRDVGAPPLKAWAMRKARARDLDDVAAAPQPDAS